MNLFLAMIFGVGATFTIGGLIESGSYSFYHGAWLAVDLTLWIYFMGKSLKEI